MLAEFLLFTVCGAVVYHYTGSQYTTAPAYGSLVLKYGRVAAGFTLPTIICVGILYSLVTSRAIFFQIFGPGSRHRRTHTPLGWSVWTGIVLVGWIISFIIGQAVPFFFSLLALISALFDSVRRNFSSLDESALTCVPVVWVHHVGSSVLRAESRILLQGSPIDPLDNRCRKHDCYRLLLRA